MPRISTDNYDTVASWNGSQDLFVVEQPDGTKVATPAMVKQYVLGNSIDDIYSVMGQNGAKNLIPYPYYETTKTVNGVTFTDNGDGTVTVSGTASADATFDIRNIWSASDIVELLPNTIYAFSGCPVGGGTSTYSIQFANEESDMSNKSWYDDIGTGGTLTTTDVKRFVGSRIIIKSGTAFSTPVTFKPMLRLASDTDNTYEPYAMTNKQLTDQLETKQDTLTFDNAPTANSNNPVKSGGIYTAIKSQVSVYTMADQSVSVTGPYTDIQLTKPVETGYTFYLIAAFAYNTRNWNLSNINVEAGAIRIFSPENTTVSSNLKTIWLKVKNS